MLARLGILLTCLMAAWGLAGAASGHAASRAPRNVLTRTNWASGGYHRHACARRSVRRVASRIQSKRGHTAVRCGSHVKPLAARRILARAAAARKHHKRAKPASVSGSPGGWSSFSSHVETWALDDCGEGSGTSSSLVRAWASYVETNCGPGGVAKALSDCHSGSSVFCNVIQYLDTNWIFQQGSPPYSQSSVRRRRRAGISMCRARARGCRPVVLAVGI